MDVRWKRRGEERRGGDVKKLEWTCLSQRGGAEEQEEYE